MAMTVTVDEVLSEVWAPDEEVEDETTIDEELVIGCTTMTVCADPEEEMSVAFDEEALLVAFACTTAINVVVSVP